MIKSILVDHNNQALKTCIGLCGTPVLIAESFKLLGSQWAVVQNTNAETETIISTKPKEAIIVFDLMIVSRVKVAGSTIVVRFSDGTNNYNLPVMEAVEKTFEFSQSFSAGLMGWEEADLEVITDAAGQEVDALVTYARLSGDLVLSYNDWIGRK